MALSHREAEIRAECSQEEATHRDKMVATLTEELDTLREQLDDKTVHMKRWSPHLISFQVNFYSMLNIMLWNGMEHWNDVNYISFNIRGYTWVYI